MSDNKFKYCESTNFYKRLETRVVNIGGIPLGGSNPIRVQSMTTTDTMNIVDTVNQSIRMIKAGCEYVRITAPNVKQAHNLSKIKKDLASKGFKTPLIADIHFTPKAAEIAAEIVSKVRINPGNYADRKRFQKFEINDNEYNIELERIHEKFSPLVKICKENGTVMRIGTNHGSLSDRIMNKYGDTPLGMVESALEYIRICEDHNYKDIVLSMKSSNPIVMVNAYRLLVHHMMKNKMNYPLHLGVTEAGDGEDGRIKSAIGIGSLLCDGLGDTIRVSLTEDSPNEIAVCSDLISQVEELTDSTVNIPNVALPYNPFEFQRRETPEIELTDEVKCGGEQTIRVVVTQEAWKKLSPRIRPGDDVKPEAIYEELNLLEVDPREPINVNCDTQLITVKDDINLPVITAFRLLAGQLKAAGASNPILLKDCLSFDGMPLEPNIALLRAAMVVGSLLCDGIGDAILIRGESGAGQSLRLAYNILQAAGCRSFKTDYVACPSCGRTLFDLQEVTARIKSRTDHLKGVKIAIMGCIVNGPGEMADADFGYVGGAPNKINLYVGKTPVRMNIPEAEAVESLVDLIREHGKWVDPAADPVTA